MIKKNACFKNDFKNSAGGIWRVFPQPSLNKLILLSLAVSFLHFYLLFKWEQLLYGMPILGYISLLAGNS